METDQRVCRPISAVLNDNDGIRPTRGACIPILDRDIFRPIPERRRVSIAMAGLPDTVQLGDAPVSINLNERARRLETSCPCRLRPWLGVLLALLLYGLTLPRYIRPPMTNVP